MNSQSSLPNYQSAEPVDTICVEVNDPRIAPDSIKLSSGTKLVRGIQVMLQAAAWAAASPSGILEGPKPSLTNKYLRAVQLGQTQHAPFGITVHSPLSPEFDSADDDKPYSRLAVQTLAQALRALVDFALQPKWEDDALLALINKGISANLCAGAATLIQSLGKKKSTKKVSLESNLSTIRVAFGWSPTLAPTAGVPNSVTLEPDMWENIKQLENTLKSFVKDNFQFEGYITQFAIHGQKEGKITIQRASDERPGRFLLEVSELEYDKAIDALRDKNLVSGKGTLVRNGGKFHLSDVTDFDIES